MGRNICDAKRIAQIHTPACVQIDTHDHIRKTNCANQNGGTQPY